MAKTILLADDSVTIQKVVELTFMDQDYKVIAVSNGSAAIARLAEFKPDIVIADVHMPGANGYEVTRRAKQVHPGIPVLLLIGTFEPFDEREAVACGAEAHLKKPFDSQDLLREVARLTVATAPPMAEPAPEIFDEETQPLEPLTDTDDLGFEHELVPIEPEPAAPGSGWDSAPATPTFTAPWATEPAASAFIPAPEPLPQAAPEPFAFVPEPAFSPAPEPAFLHQPEPLIPPPEPVLLTPQVATPKSVPTASAVPQPSPASAADANGGMLGDADIERIARRVVELISADAVREVAWEIVPDLAEVLIKERLRELESQVE